MLPAKDRRGNCRTRGHRMASWAPCDHPKTGVAARMRQSTRPAIASGPAVAAAARQGRCTRAAGMHPDDLLRGDAAQFGPAATAGGPRPVGDSLYSRRPLSLTFTAAATRRTIALVPRTCRPANTDRPSRWSGENSRGAVPITRRCPVAFDDHVPECSGGFRPGDGDERTAFSSLGCVTVACRTLGLPSPRS
jgi:hypothetical protein